MEEKSQKTEEPRFIIVKKKREEVSKEETKEETAEQKQELIQQKAGYKEQIKPQGRRPDRKKKGERKKYFQPKVEQEVKEEEKKLEVSEEKKEKIEEKKEAKLEQAEVKVEKEETERKEEKAKEEAEGIGDEKVEVEFFVGQEDIIPFRAKRFFSYRKKKKKPLKQQISQPKEVEEKPKRIKISGSIRVAELSKLTGIKASEIIRKLLELGREVTINQFISAEEAEIVCADYGIEVEIEEFDESKYFDTSPDPEEKLVKRPPVVVVMGHVDHGKTTLLDAIRKTNVAEKEVGGITQSIGAYTVDVRGEKITFIDTPGHEAFTEMRARGAKVADIAVLVVAADEGVKPQTEEAISHASAAGLPIVVAINKIDKPGANPDFVKNQLANLGLVPDDWGGDTLFANISAKKRIGLDELLEKILLQAEIMNLRANPSRPAEGVIIESSIDKGLGAVATVIVQRGTLRKGDVFVAGMMWGRVRNIFSDKGEVIKEVLPGFPAKIVIGGSEIPYAGSKLYVVQNEDIASRIVEERKLREAKKIVSTVSLEDIFEKIKKAGEEKVILPLVLKASSAGALDALEKEISLIKHPSVEIKVIHRGIGIISPSDINLAAASKGIVIGYSVGIDKNAHNLAKTLGVQVRMYKIIYEILDDIKKALQGMLKPKEKEVVIGRAKILKIFKLSSGRALGCYMESGKFVNGLYVKVKRNGEVIGTGKIVSLKRFKDSVQEVSEGNEFGVMIDGVQDVKENDILECFQIEKEEISLES